MMTIESGSEAAVYLLKALDHMQSRNQEPRPDRTNVQIAHQPQTQQILLKVNSDLNDGTWSKPLNLTR